MLSKLSTITVRKAINTAIARLNNTAYINKLTSASKFSILFRPIQSVRKTSFFLQISIPVKPSAFQSVNLHDTSENQNKRSRSGK